MIDGSRNIELLEDLDTIEPQLEIPCIVGLPIGLYDNLVKLASTDGSDLGKRRGLLGTYSTVPDPSIQLVSLEPDHGTGHPVVAAGVAEVGDELSDVVALGTAKVPIFLEAELEAIEVHVAFTIDVVFADVGVISARVVGVIYLTAFDGGRAFVEYVAHLLDRALMFLVDVAPALGSALVAEDLRSMAQKW